MISITIVNSVLGSVNGDMINVVITRQMSNEINNVITILTQHKSDKYKPHCINQILNDSGFPEKKLPSKF